MNNILKPKGYDGIQVSVDRPRIKPDGYVCQILKATTETSQNGNISLVIYFDIAEGDFKGYYKQDYEEQVATPEKGWAHRGNYEDYEVRGFNETNPLLTLLFKEDELILLEEEKQAMKKSDLKQGALVQSRSGELHILLGDKLVDLSNGRYMRLEDIGEDLLCERFFNKELSVDRVFQSGDTSEGYRRYIRKEPIKWTWERKEEEPHKELTVGEIEKLLGYKVKIVKENEGNK